MVFCWQQSIFWHFKFSGERIDQYFEQVSGKAKHIEEWGQCTLYFYSAIIQFHINLSCTEHWGLMHMNETQARKDTLHINYTLNKNNHYILSYLYNITWLGPCWFTSLVSKIIYMKDFTSLLLYSLIVKALTQAVHMSEMHHPNTHTHTQTSAFCCQSIHVYHWCTFLQAFALRGNVSVSASCPI